MIYYMMAAVLAYLISSISPSVWLGRYVYKQDLRKYGSKNPGASNATYVFGPVGGLIVLVADVMKGFLSVLFVDFLFRGTVDDPHLLLFLASFFAIVGHCKSLFLRFKGGKGFATFIGVNLYHFPHVTAVILIIWAISVLVTKYIVAGTFSTILSFPLIIHYLNTHEHYLHTTTIVVMWAITLFIFYRHRENIVKLMNGTEISIRTPRIGKEELESKD